MKINKLLLLFLFSWPLLLVAQRQYSDSSYSPPPFLPYFAEGAGPSVYIDTTHNNFHTRTGRYAPFAKVLEQDGFVVKDFYQTFTPAGLKEIDILVIANALPATSLGRWEAPTASAFTAEEISAVQAWVEHGGKLFLLADHMPMAGAAADLAEAFGYTFYDSFASDTSSNSGAARFQLVDGSLSHHALLQGIEGRMAIDSVTSFTGQAFATPEGAHSILNCGPDWIILMPEIAWQFNEETPSLTAAGWSQFAYQNYGQGKLVVAGEAAMFSAQIVEMQDRRFTAGMNSPLGRYNYRLLLNIVRWLGE